MKLFLIFCICLSFKFCPAQITKKQIYGYSASALSGFFYGLNQATVHHKFNEGKQFWDPRLSFKNKYKNWPTDKKAKFPGSKTWLVWTTDAQHLTSTLEKGFLITGVVALTLDSKKKNWKAILLKDIIIPSLIRGIVFEVTFNNL